MPATEHAMVVTVDQSKTLCLPSLSLFTVQILKPNRSHAQLPQYSHTQTPFAFNSCLNSAVKYFWICWFVFKLNSGSSLTLFGTSSFARVKQVCSYELLDNVGAQNNLNVVLQHFQAYVTVVVPLTLVLPLDKARGAHMFKLSAKQVECNNYFILDSAHYK